MNIDDVSRAEIYRLVKAIRGAASHLECEATDATPDLLAVQNYATMICEAAGRVVVSVEERMPDAYSFVGPVYDAGGNPPRLSGFAVGLPVNVSVG